MEIYYEQWSNCPPGDPESNSASSKQTRAVNQIKQSLISAQELGDEKMQVVTQLQEIIDQKTRQLDVDFKNLDYGARDDPGMASSSPKDTHPSSPASVPLSGNNVKVEIKNEDGSSTSTSASIASLNAERTNNVSSSASGAGSTSSNNGGDRSWKRSRRGRDAVSSRGNNSNQFSSSNKAGSAMDIDRVETSVSSTSKSTTSVQAAQSSVAASTSANVQNKKQAAAANKKKKRKSGRSQSGIATGAGNGGNSSGVTASGNNGGNGGNNSHHTRPHDDTPPLEETIDPDEPTYCLCDQISFGEMILCDNDLCPIEWFHFSCVSLTTKPKGKWFCPNCRGERPSIMKPKQQFLKELERYNREKEEKS